MDAESLIRTALREAGYGQDAIGSALPRIMRILEAEDVRLEVGRPLSRKERDDLHDHLRNTEIIPRRDKMDKEKKTEFKDRQLDTALKYLREQARASR